MVEGTIKYTAQKSLQLLEFEKLLKFSQESLEGFIRPIEDEIIVITILGSTGSNSHKVANKLIEVNFDSEIEEENLLDDNTTGLWIFTQTFHQKNSSNSNTKILILHASGIEKEEFNNKIYGMIHSISSTIILVTEKKELSDLSKISLLKKTYSGGNSEEIIKNLSPKFIFCNLNNSTSEASNDFCSNLIDYLEKEDELSDFFIKYYKERTVFCVSFSSINQFQTEDLFSESTTQFSKLIKSIYYDSYSKSYRGKKLNGLTLRNMLIEFVNCINQGIGFNINKM